MHRLSVFAARVLMAFILGACQLPPPRAPVAELTTFNPPRIQIIRPPRLRTPPAALMFAAPLGTDFTIVPRVGHSDAVLAVDVAKDGELAVTASRDATVKIWDLRSGALLRTIVAAGVATTVVLLDDGQRAITGGRDGKLRLWAVPTGQLLRTMTVTHGADRPITALAVTPLGGHAAVAYGSGEGALAIYDLATAQRTRQVTTSARIGALAFTNDGRDLISGGDGGALKRYARSTLVLHRTIAGHAREVSALATSADGRRVLSASADGRLKLWDVTSGALLSVIAAHSQPVRGVAVSKDAKRALSASEDGTIKFWDIDAKRVLATMRGHVGAVTALAAAEGDFGVVSGGSDGSVVTWDPTVGEALTVLPAYDDTVAHASLSGSGRSALTVSDDGDMRLWDLASLFVARQWSGGHGVTAAALSPDASAALIAKTKHHGLGVLELWDVGTGQVSHRFETRSGTVVSTAFSPDGSRALTGSVLGSVRLWGTAIRRPLRQLVGHTSPVRALSISERGRRALTSAVAPMVGPDRIKVWDLDTGAELLSFDGYAVGALSADGRRAAVASKKGELTVLDLEAGSVERSWVGHAAAVRAVAVDRTMRIIVSGDDVGTIKIWDNINDRLARTLTGHRGPIRSLHVSRGGKRVVSSGNDGTMRVWRLDTGASVTLVARGNEWLVFAEDGYFAASPRGAELAYAVTGARGFRLDQLAALHNRPDILLERIGGGSVELKQDVAARHRRRLRALGVSQQQLIHRYGDAPRVAMTSLEQQGKRLTVGFRVAVQGPPARYQVLVNGVPWLAEPARVGGRRGPGGPVMSDEREEVILGIGRNRIEVEVIDDVGARAIPASHVVRLDVPAAERRKRRGVLHYVGIGVSRYKHNGLDLGYAQRDALALGRALATAKGAYRDVRVHTLLDAQVRADAIERLRAELKTAAVDDTVVVFVAGHWAHTRGLPADPVFLPHDADPERLSATAISWESLVGLVTGIRARRRLLIADGCVSGDRDDGALREALGEARRRGLRPRTSAVLHPPPNMPPRTFLFQNRRMIMGTLLRRSGAVMLQASRGSELCYELDDTQSGALTAAVLSALTTPDADRDENGWVSLAELSAFVVPFVANMTGGLQHPIVVRSGVQQDIELPRIDSVPPRSMVPQPSPSSTAPQMPPGGRPPPGCGCRLVGEASTGEPPDAQNAVDAGHRGDSGEGSGLWPWLMLSSLVAAITRRRGAA